MLYVLHVMRVFFFLLIRRPPRSCRPDALVPYTALFRALAAAVARVQPDAGLIANAIEGRDVAGRLSARLRLAVAADAVGVSRDEQGVLAQQERKSTRLNSSH